MSRVNKQTKKHYISQGIMEISDIERSISSILESSSHFRSENEKQGEFFRIITSYAVFWDV